MRCFNTTWARRCCLLGGRWAAEGAGDEAAATAARDEHQRRDAQADARRAGLQTEPASRLAHTFLHAILQSSGLPFDPLMWPAIPQRVTGPVNLMRVHPQCRRQLLNGPQSHAFRL